MRCATPPARSPHAPRATTNVLGRTDLVGKIGDAGGAAGQPDVGGEPGSLVRKVDREGHRGVGVRLLPPFARQRFSTWFKQRPRVRIDQRQGTVAVFPTCLVEYQEPGDRP